MQNALSFSIAAGAQAGGKDGRHRRRRRRRRQLSATMKTRARSGGGRGGRGSKRGGRGSERGAAASRAGAAVGKKQKPVGKGNKKRASAAPAAEVIVPALQLPASRLAPPAPAGDGSVTAGVLHSASAAAAAADKAAPDGGGSRRAVRAEGGLTYLEATTAAAKKTSRATLAGAGLPSAAAMAAAMAALDADPETARAQGEQRSAVARLTSVDKMREIEHYMEAGCSLLFYGLGSKFEALEKLAQKIADEGQGRGREVIAVDGFSPLVGVRSLLIQVAEAVMPEGAVFKKKHVLDYVQAIKEAMNGEEGDGGDVRNRGMASKQSVGGGDVGAAIASSLVLVIHNIDGVSLRSPETQSVLSLLAEIPRVIVVASIDHVNAPLMWDGAMYSRFRWRWMALSTYARYSREMALTTEPLLAGGEESRVESAVALLNSLSPNARRLFEILARMQVGTDRMGGEDGGGGGGGGGDVGNGNGAAGKKRKRRARDGSDDSSSDDSSESDSEGGGRKATGGSQSKRKRSRVDGGEAGGARAPLRRTTFVELFTRCREEFLSSDPVSVKSFLTELETHDLLKRRRGSDAAEQLWIPLSADQLGTVMESVAS